MTSGRCLTAATSPKGLWPCSPGPAILNPLPPSRPATDIEDALETPPPSGAQSSADRMGLPAGLHQQRRPHPSPCPLARVLQHSTPTHRTRRPPTDQPTVTNLMAGYI